MAGPHVLIIGMMGVGKTTTGLALAEEIGWPYLDSDADIELLTGSTGREIAERQGVEALHELEAALLLGALARSTPHVITAAASVVENDLVRLAVPRRSVVGRLDLPVELMLARQATGSHRRAMDADEVRKLAKRREPLFCELEDIRLDASEAVGTLVTSLIGEITAKGLF